MVELRTKFQAAHVISMVKDERKLFPVESELSAQYFMLP